MLNQQLKPMLLQPLLSADIKNGWRSSLKWDGFRILIHYDHGKVRAFSRHGTEVTDRFPELMQIKLPAKSAILDGLYRIRFNTAIGPTQIVVGRCYG